MKKVLLSSLVLAVVASSISYADNASAAVCPTDLKYKTIGMRDMSFKYVQYKDYICAILEVELNKNKQWQERGSGWFAAGFGAKTMKDSNMFIFVPQKSQSQDVRYDVFANIGGAYGPYSTTKRTNRAFIIFIS